ncbi:hypothetical protein EHE19_005005 [Ruminiclostridium herbifermentans]|uniref:Lipoprotein n=1 Tax=Ruminiclostridium herbifermentans TaxID=2488810 RepID=A0A4U7JEM7_9FIRM|nr:hypothetical protein [Ruminiclostridium herbifermentans]QNU67821.1 hypothetical protein EHE19_005005 [Ruminiclostridium herbifermentans]
MKKKLILCVLCSVVFLPACSNNENPSNVKDMYTNNSVSENSTSVNTNIDSIPSFSSQGDTVEENLNSNKELEQMDNNQEKNTVTEPFLFGEKDIYINNKPVLNSTYAQLIKDFGLPKEINKFKINPPATEEDYFKYFKVLAYDGFECEFSLGEEDSEVEDTDNIFRFDITNEKVQLDCGLRVGMTTDEILSKYGKRDIYNINGTNEDSEFIKIILESYKPDGYYSEYSQAMIIYFDQDKFEDPLAKALILLINNNKLDRIVFCYPTAE